MGTKLLAISIKLFADFVIDGNVLEVLEGLPRGTRVVAAFINHQKQSIDLQVESVEWEDSDSCYLEEVGSPTFTLYSEFQRTRDLATFATAILEEHVYHLTGVKTQGLREELKGDLFHKFDTITNLIWQSTEGSPDEQQKRSQESLANLGQAVCSIVAKRPESEVAYDRGRLVGLQQEVFDLVVSALQPATGTENHLLTYLTGMLDNMSRSPCNSLGTPESDESKRFTEARLALTDEEKVLVERISKKLCYK